MYKCWDCGAIFEEPNYYEECVGEFWGAPAYMTIGTCPCCGSDSYEEYDEDEDEEFELEEELEDDDCVGDYGEDD